MQKAKEVGTTANEYGKKVMIVSYKQINTFY